MTETIEERAKRLQPTHSTRRKFTSAQIFDIYRLLELGASQAAIAKDEKVDVQVIHAIAHGRTYKPEFAAWEKRKADQQEQQDD